MKRKEVKPSHHKWLKLVGAKIRDLRLEKGYSYIALAEEIGISRNSYNALEIGNDYFNISTLLQVLDYHKLSVNTFLCSLEEE